MPSISSAVRQLLFARMADQYNGLNPLFVASCNAQAIPVPMPSTGGTALAPFDFSATSPNVFRFMIPHPDALDMGKHFQVQYPLLFVSVRNARQDPRPNRVTPSTFSGSVTVVM